MSHAATNWAIQQRGLKPAAKIVLWHLADCHNPAMGCFPSQEYLAEQCEMSRSTINLHLSSLEEAGLIRRERCHNDANRRENTRYVLGFENVANGDESADSMSENRTWKTPEPCPENGPGHVRKNADSMSELSDTEPVIEPVIEPLSAREAPEREDLKGRERAFKRFAPTWPTWLSSSEPAARKAWFALGEAECGQAEARAADYVAGVKAEGRSMVCTLQVYLAERRWERLGAPKPPPAAAGEALAPWGKAFMARRLDLLARSERREFRPTATQERMLAAGREHLVDAARRRHQFPAVARLDEAAMAGRTLTLPPGTDLPDTGGYVAVRPGSPEWQACADWHDRRDLPWVDPPGHVQFVWLPGWMAAGLEEAEAEMEAGE